jgi:hypothetical protein
MNNNKNNEKLLKVKRGWIQNWVYSKIVAHKSVQIDDPLYDQPPFVGYTRTLDLNGSNILQDDDLEINKFTTFITNPQKFYRTDVFYYIELGLNNNKARIGFLMDATSVNHKTINTTSILKPTFYYESFTGKCYAGTQLIKTINANMTSILIRLDENLNFYIGRTDTNYQLICNIMDYSVNNTLNNQELINNINLPFRLCIEIEATNSQDYRFSLLNNGFKEYSNIATSGISWPNWGITSSSERLLTSSLTSTNNYKINFINTLLPITAGTRASFTLKSLNNNIDELYIGIMPNNTSIASFTSLINTGLTSSIYYNSVNNIYFENGIDNGLPDLYIFPNIGSNNGQIYFMIDEDKKVYSGFGPNTSFYIGTYQSNDILKFVLITRGPINETGTFYFVDNSLNDPQPTNYILDPSNDKAPLQGFTFIPDSLPNDTNTQALTSLIMDRYTSYIKETSRYYGVDTFYYITITPFDNEYKIGFYTDDTISPSSLTTDSNKPQFYYDSIDGGCWVGNELKARIRDGLTRLFIRMDENLNFYIGETETNYILVENLKVMYDNTPSNMSLINKNKKTFRFGYQVYTKESTQFNIHVENSGFKIGTSIQTNGVGWPNWGFVDSPSSLVSFNLAADTDYTYYVISPFNGIQSGIKYEFTLQCDSSQVNSLYIYIGYTSSSTNSALENIITSGIYYNSSTGKYYYGFQPYSLVAGQPAFYPNPNINTSNISQIYFKIDGNSIYSGYSRSTLSNIVNLPSTPLHCAIITKNIIGNSSGIFKFIPEDLDNPSPVVNPLDYPSDVQAPLTGFISGPSLYNSLTYTNTSLVQDEYKTYIRETGLLLRQDQYYYINLAGVGNGNSIRIGYLMDNVIADGIYSNLAAPTVQVPSMYYESSTGKCYFGTILMDTIHPNLESLFIRIDQDLNFYIGRTDTNYRLIGSMPFDLSYQIFRNINWAPRLFYEFYKPSAITPSNSSITLIDSGYKEFSQVALQGKSWPNIGIENITNNRRFLNISSTFNQGYTYLLVSAINGTSTKTTFTIDVQTSSISKMYVVLNQYGITGNITSYNPITQTGDTVYDSDRNLYFDKGKLIGLPEIYPYPSLKQNGQIYFKIEQDGKVYSGFNDATSSLISTRANQIIYIYLLFYNQTVPGNGHFRFIENDYVTPPHVGPAPLDPLYNQPPLQGGYTNTGLLLANGDVEHSITNMVSGRFYTFIAQEELPYNTEVYYLIDLTGSGNIKIGLLLNGNIDTMTYDNAVSTIVPNYYYNSKDGGIWKGTQLLAALPKNLTSIFIRLDENLNLYFGRTITNYQMVGNLAAAPLDLNNNTHSFRLCYEIQI